MGNKTYDEVEVLLEKFKVVLLEICKGNTEGENFKEFATALLDSFMAMKTSKKKKGEKQTEMSDRLAARFADKRFQCEKCLLVLASMPARHYDRCSDPGNKHIIYQVELCEKLG